MAKSNLADADFGFDDVDTFFGVKTEPTEVAKIKGVKEGAEGETTDVSTKEVKDNPEDEDLDFFNIDKDDKEDDTEDGEEDTKTEVKDKEAKDKTPKEVKVGDEKGDDKKDDKLEEGDKFFSQLALELKENGVFQNVDIPTDKEITEEQFFEMQNNEIEARVEETIQALSEKLKDPMAVAFIKHLKDNGTAKGFIDTYSQGLDYKSLDVDKPEDADKVLRHYFSTVEGLDEEEVADRIKWLKDGGKDKAATSKYLKILEKKDEDSRLALEESTKQAQQNRIAQRAEFNKTLTDNIAKTENIKGIAISKSLPEFFTKAVIKVDKNTYVPPFQAKLGKVLKPSTPEDVEKLILLGQLLENDFDFTQLDKKAKTEATKKVRSKLQEVKGAVKTRNTGSVNGGVSLADAFN